MSALRKYNTSKCAQQWAAGRAMHQSEGKLSANLEILIFCASLYKGFQVARPACGFFEQGGARSGQTLAQRHYKR